MHPKRRARPQATTRTTEYASKEGKVSVSSLCASVKPFHFLRESCEPISRIRLPTQDDFLVSMQARHFAGTEAVLASETRLGPLIQDFYPSGVFVY